MDEDALSRKEAIGGLGLLAALMLALVGVIVSRIVGAKPEVRQPLGEATLAAEQSAAIGSDWPAVGAVEDPVVETQAGSPIPTAAKIGPASVPLASGVDSAQQFPPSAVQPPAETAPTARPIFVTPGSRATPPTTTN